MPMESKGEALREERANAWTRVSDKSGEDEFWSSTSLLSVICDEGSAF